MSEIVLQVEHLSKKFRIGKKLLKSLTFRDFIVDKFNQINPFQKKEPLINNGVIWALKDLNFSVKKGDTIGIIGNNGAGKSTLLKVLSKITPPTTGLIKRKGRVSSLLEVGTGFHDELTGRENIFLNGSILGLTRKEINQRFDEIVAFSGVEAFLDTPIKRYSSGMIVRLAFSVAAHLEPDILIIDEVLAVGDLAFQKKCLQKMEDSSKSGKTILFVSHNHEHILKICKKGILLDKGKLVYQGPIEEVIDIYLNNLRTNLIYSLENRPDRQGSGSLKVTKILLLNEENIPIDIVSPGQNIKIAFQYNVDSFLKKKEISISITVSNNLGIKIFKHANKFNALFFNGTAIQNAQQFVLSIQNFCFPKGDYFLNFTIQENDQVLDHLPNAICLKVDDSPFGRNANNPPVSKGTTLIDGQWSLH